MKYILFKSRYFILRCACASIEEKKIYRNLKVNVAFGGQTGFMTRVTDNEIYRRRSEGVFCIDSEERLIARN